MDYKDSEFASELYVKLKELEDFVVESGYQDKVISSIVFGIITNEDTRKEDEERQVNAVYSYNLMSRNELEVIKHIMDTTYEDDDDDILGDLLDGLDISLN